MIRLGTRGSKLALAQSRLVADQLLRLGADVEMVVITTSGDRFSSAPPDGSATGIFVKELEAALIGGVIDLAVHSLKDMPTELPEGLALGAVLSRASALDALVCQPRGATLDQLPPGARIGTSSPRRRAQLLHYRRDLQMLPVRGNVDTRLRKLEAGGFDAIILAHAGLERLGLGDLEPYIIPAGICLPAPGQGALAIQIRADDDQTARLIQPLEDVGTRACVTAERALLNALGGGCRAAVGALGTMVGNMLRLEGVVADPHGGRLLRGAVEGAPTEAAAVGQSLACDLAARGAGALIEAAR
jgi:hydroxymethylbilane synthase